jgi:hypothetical protein
VDVAGGVGTEVVVDVVVVVGVGGVVFRVVLRVVLRVDGSGSEIVRASGGWVGVRGCVA